MCDSDNQGPFIVDTSFTRRSVVLTMSSLAAVTALPNGGIRVRQGHRKPM